MWDDKYLNNQDFSTIYPFFTNEQLNKLELKFLELIQYNTHINFSTYNKYYLVLKAIKTDFPLKPMDIFTKEKYQNFKSLCDKLKYPKN